MKWLIIIALVLASCTQKEKKAQIPQPVKLIGDTVIPATIAGNFSDQTTLRFDSSAIDSFILSIHYFPDFRMS
jgi:hypothetical protein